MTDISELIERVRMATGPDRELDEALHVHFRYPPKPWNYTASIDAALALVERVLPGWNYTLNRGHCELRHPKQRAQDVQAFGPTPALAIIRALILSLQSEADK